MRGEVITKYNPSSGGDRPEPHLTHTDDAVHGPELWVSDGTAAGTHLLLDIVPGAQVTGPTALASANALLYFNATSPATVTGACGATGPLREPSR